MHWVRSKYGLQENGWDVASSVRVTHDCPWKFISQVSVMYFPLVKYKLGDGLRIRFWEDMWLGDHPLRIRFPRVFRLSTLHEASISHFYSSGDDSWNLHLRRNPYDWELDELTSLINALSTAHFSSQSDSRVWLGDNHGVFSSKSFLAYLTAPSKYSLFPIASFLWKAKVPFKVRAFVWTMSLGKINTNDMFQRRRPKSALSPDICVLCMASGETTSHLFLHCHFARCLWNRLFCVFGELWVCPSSVLQFLQISYMGFGRDKEKKLLWRNAVLAILWCIWLNRNARVFPQKATSTYIAYSHDLLWDRVTFLASLWTKSVGAFVDQPLSVLQRNWSSL